jgi:hypothetical protein
LGERAAESSRSGANQPIPHLIASRRAGGCDPGEGQERTRPGPSGRSIPDLGRGGRGTERRFLQQEAPVRSAAGAGRRRPGWLAPVSSGGGAQEAWAVLAVGPERLRGPEQSRSDPGAGLGGEADGSAGDEDGIDLQKTSQMGQRQ